MSASRVIGLVAAALLGGVTAFTQGEVADPAIKPLPNPNPKVVKNFGALPDGRVWGNTAGVDIAPDGHVWAYDRCGTNSCAGSNVDPIVKFDRNSGKLLASFGRGTFIFPHGIHVDRDGNVWVTDGRAASKEELAKFPNEAGKGHTVRKFSPDGKVLLTLGKPGVGVRGTDTFNEPNDVITAPNGDIFVSDGHSGQNPTATPDTNARIVKFTRDGKFVKEWGKFGSGPSEFRTPHALAMDSQRPPVRRRPRQPPDPDLRPGREVPPGVEAVQPNQRAVHHAQRHALRDRLGVEPRAASELEDRRPDRDRPGKTRCCSSSRRTTPDSRTARPAKAWRSIATATSMGPKDRSRARPPAAD